MSKLYKLKTTALAFVSLTLFTSEYSYGMDSEKEDKDDFLRHSPRNEIIALKEKGDADSLFQLGLIYVNDDKRVKKNVPLAIEYFENAAKEGDIDSLFQLGQLYLKGEGVEENVEKAVKYFKTATLHNHRDSFYKLGQIYFYGKGVEMNIKKAIKYFEKAAKEGHEEANKMFKKLEEDLI